ncbi:sugar transferase [Mesorhizobium australicum]|uniref:Sugar transferase n=1 Tax=Mesorhizobium australicum TaxID=536018 RepID=A0A1X7PFC7_9HYPH|nr:sugar transferase [Mesorhizobium australicum]SMH49152.1 sugar transferase [Mesorhizobium australicum]
MDLAFQFLIGILGVLVAVLVATFSRVLADDAKAWLPLLTSRLVERAASRLPVNSRDRYREEWSSHVNDTPGDFSKFVVALGLIRGASKIAASDPIEGNADRPSFAERAIALCWFVLVAPLLLGSAIAIKAESAGPVFVSRVRISESGKKTRTLRFRTKEHAGPKRGSETRIGRFLGRAGIAELPILYSVFLGQEKLPRNWWKKYIGSGR